MKSNEKFSQDICNILKEAAEEKMETASQEDVEPEETIYSGGFDTFNKDVYVREPFYTSHILTSGNSFINYSGADDSVKHDFFSGPQKFIESLRVQFLYMSNGRLIPYDFRNQYHILKFEIECNTGKFKSIADQTAPDLGVLPPPISIPDFEDPYRWKQYVLISVIVFIGVFTLIVTRKRT